MFPICYRSGRGRLTSRSRPSHNLFGAVTSFLRIPAWEIFVPVLISSGHRAKLPPDKSLSIGIQAIVPRLPPARAYRPGVSFLSTFLSAPRGVAVACVHL